MQESRERAQIRGYLSHGDVLEDALRGCVVARDPYIEADALRLLCNASRATGINRSDIVTAKIAQARDAGSRFCAYWARGRVVEDRQKEHEGNNGHILSLETRFSIHCFG